MKTLDKGFTLIEVVVALVIMGLVLGAIYRTIHAQVDLRYRLQQRYFAQTVAWNRLLKQYQALQKWAPAGQAADKQGETKIYGRDWYWEMDVKETFGEDFYRYEVKSYTDPGRPQPSVDALVAYFVAE